MNPRDEGCQDGPAPIEPDAEERSLRDASETRDPGEANRYPMDPKDNPLLEALEDRSRSGDPAADPRYEALTAGQLDVGQIAALRALGAASAQHRAAFEAFQPMGDELRAKLFARANLSDPRSATVPAVPAAEVLSALATETSEGTPAQTRHDASEPPPTLWERVKAFLWPAIAIPAVASAVALWWWPSVPAFTPTTNNLFASPTAALMGHGEAGQFVHAGTVVEVGLVAQGGDEPLSPALRARAFGVQGESGVALTAPVAGRDGGFRLALPADKLIDALDEGPAEIVVFVGEPDELPEDGGEAVVTETSRSLAVVRIPVTLP